MPSSDMYPKSMMNLSSGRPVSTALMTTVVRRNIPRSISRDSAETTLAMYARTSGCRLWYTATPWARRRVNVVGGYTWRIQRIVWMTTSTAGQQSPRKTVSYSRKEVSVSIVSDISCCGFH